MEIFVFVQVFENNPRLKSSKLFPKGEKGSRRTETMEVTTSWESGMSIATGNNRNERGVCE